MSSRRESWVHPPILASEAPPGWVAVWRFRAAAAFVLAVLVLLIVVLVLQLTGSNDQDPGVGAMRAVSRVTAA